MSNFQEEVTFIWGLADLLRGSYKSNDYQKVILPFTVLKRFDSVLEYSKNNVLDTYDNYKDSTKNLDSVLKKAALNKDGKELGFYNYSKYSFQSLVDDPQNLESNFINYIDSFSPNIKEIFDNFYLKKQIRRLAVNNILFILIKKFNELNLNPDSVSNHEMGKIFEMLIIKSVESSSGSGGEYITPKDVVELMIKLLVSESSFLEEKELLKIYDPACGTGGLLTRCKDLLKERKVSAEIQLYGQELNEEIYATCKAEMLIRGEDPKKIKGPGSTLKDDQLPNEKFDLIISQPPFGRRWAQDEEIILKEAEDLSGGRFRAGLPRKNDSQLLFLQHALSKMKNEKSRIVFITSGTPLFEGFAGTGESNIRKWIIENDYLEAIIALPGHLFYNTEIPTYIWVLSNKKPLERVGKIQLIDSISKYVKISNKVDRKSNRFSNEDISIVIDSYVKFEENNVSRIFDNEEFGYYKLKFEIKNEAQKTSKNYIKIPLKEDIEEYFDKQVVSLYQKARLLKDEVLIGYEIRFTKNFYKYHPPIVIDKNYPLKQLSEIATIGQFDEIDDVLIIPYFSTKKVILKPEFDENFDNNSRKHYFECKINDPNVLPQYLKIYLNSELGKFQRRLFSQGSIISQINKDGVNSIYIAIPDLNTQKGIIDADQQITEWYNETFSLYSRFKNKIFNFEDLLDIISTFKSDDNISDDESSEDVYPNRNPLYDDVLWPLASSYISATKGSSEPVERALNYFNLFELVAAFNSIFLLSSLPHEIYQEKKEIIWGKYRDYEQISFGNWVGLYRNLSKIYQKEKMNLPFNEEIYKNICSPKIVNILNSIPEKRNKSFHGGVITPINAENAVLELKPYLNDIFKILMSYNTLKLIYIERSDKKGKIYKTKVKRLNGACYPFIHECISTTEDMDSKSLYLYNPSTNERLKLKSELIKFQQCPECSLWSFYIYNKVKHKKAIYRSYQTEQHDLKVPNKTIHDIINFDIINSGDLNE